MTPAQLRGRHGHDYERLIEDAQDRGLSLPREFVDTLKVLQQLGAFSRARYQSVGIQQAIKPEHLNDLCNALAPLIGPRVLGTIPSAQTHTIEPI
jgi:hypothetical protein